MGTKLIERVEINDDNGDDDNTANKISLHYEIMPISDVKGSSADNPIIVEDYDYPDKGLVFIKGECSNSKSDGEACCYPPVFTCEICADPKPIHNKFIIQGCSHGYCCDCMGKYVASKIQENIVHVTCPVSGCIGLLDPQGCREILPRKVFDRWGDALCEAVIADAGRLYCPFKDCSAMLIGDGMDGGEVIKQSECPYCWRLFCAQCKVPWHGDNIECAEFQKLNENESGREDIMLMKLAENKSWMRCPKCGFYVERISGCLSMKCRCGYRFCYNCGGRLIDHFCTSCNR